MRPAAVTPRWNYRIVSWKNWDIALDADAQHTPTASEAPDRQRSVPSHLPPSSYFVEVLEEVGGVFVDTVRAGALELLEAVAA